MRSGISPKRLSATGVPANEQLEGKAGRTQGLGGGKSRRAGADDHDVNVFHEYSSPRHNNYLIVGKLSGIRQRCGEDA